MVYTKEQRMFLVLNYAKTESYVECRLEFIRKFPGVHVPNDSTIRRLVKKFQETGSVFDKQKNREASVVTEAKLHEIAEALEKNPRISLRRLALQTGLSTASAHRAVHKLKLKYKIKPQGSSAGESRVASGDDGCGSRVGQPAGPPPPRRTSYSQYHCAVYCCATNCHRTPGVSCHAFPKDERLRREWLARCGHKSEVNVKNSRICSVHFRPEDYERDLRNELLGLPLRRKLIPTAVPTLNLPSEEEDELTESRDVSTKRFGRSRKKLRKCAANCGEGDKMDAVVQQILMNPPEVIIKEEPVVKEESECDPGVVGAAAQQDFEFVSVKEEPVEDPDESTSPMPEEPCDEKDQYQQLPPIIKEEIDCDDYIDPLRTS